MKKLASCMALSLFLLAGPRMEGLAQDQQQVDTTPGYLKICRGWISIGDQEDGEVTAPETLECVQFINVHGKYTEEWVGFKYGKDILAGNNYLKAISNGSIYPCCTAQYHASAAPARNNHRDWLSIDCDSIYGTDHIEYSDLTAVELHNTSEHLFCLKTKRVPREKSQAKPQQ